jgi:outer membrane beta-barrel protein
MQKIFVNLLVVLLLFTPKLFAEEGSTYQFGWLDKDKEVYVLQNREYKKVSTINLNVAFGMPISEAFADGYMIQARLGYYFWESWGLELLYSKNSEEVNQTGTDLKTGYGGAGPGTTPWVNLVESYAGIIVNWSPFYSKINLFNAIVYLDWTFGLGAVSVSSKNNTEQFTTGSTSEPFSFESATSTGFLFQTSWIFYLSKAFSIRADLISINYSADAPSGSGSTKKQAVGEWDALLGVGFRF